MITDLTTVFLLFSVTPANSISYASRHPCVRFTGLDASRRLIAPYPWGSRRGRRIELVGMGRDSVSCSKITKYDVLRVSGSIRLYRLGVPSESFYSYRMRAASLPLPHPGGRPLPIHKKSTRNIRALFF